jgi:hypothetical protein
MEVRLTTTSWAPRSDLGLREWLLQGRRLGALGRGVGWWIGDWLNYGNSRYGERYARAARVTGYDRQTLMNMVYVSSRFPAARRRTALSWSHHAEIAALTVEEQEHWLDAAERERMSARSLRAELQAERRAARSAVPASMPRAGGAGPPSRMRCPHCRGVIELDAAPAPAAARAEALAAWDRTPELAR